jgi:hypothetical protein
MCDSHATLQEKGMNMALIRRKKTTKSPDLIYNEAIHKLILIKKRRVETGDTEQRILAAQKAIDAMIKRRDNYRRVSSFIAWRNMRE